MKRITVLFVTACLFAAALSGCAKKTQEIRVLVANHPYGELLKTAIPEYEKQSGKKILILETGGHSRIWC
jgi:multiple sugar transport system substrate-binding protein